MSFLEEAWEERETSKYKEIFGDVKDKIFPLNHDIFSRVFDRNEIDPTWLHSGVMVSPPSKERGSWVYVTSGMSNPWESEQKEEFSGLGIELLLQTDSEMNEAIEILLNLMAFNILLSVRHYGEKPMLDYGDRIPLQIEPNLTHVVLAEPQSFPSCFELISGQVDLMQVIALTNDEFSFAKEHGSLAILEKFKEQGYYNPKTNELLSSI